MGDSFKAFCPLQYRGVPLFCDTDITLKKCGANTVGEVEPAVLVRGKNYLLPKSHATVIYRNPDALPSDQNEHLEDPEKPD